jgi:hypothetical protein
MEGLDLTDMDPWRFKLICEFCQEKSGSCVQCMFGTVQHPPSPYLSLSLGFTRDSDSRLHAHLCVVPLLDACHVCA